MEAAIEAGRDLDREAGRDPGREAGREAGRDFPSPVLFGWQKILDMSVLTSNLCSINL